MNRCEHRFLMGTIRPLLRAVQSVVLQPDELPQGLIHRIDGMHFVTSRSSIPDRASRSCRHRQRRPARRHLSQLPRWTVLTKNDGARYEVEQLEQYRRYRLGGHALKDFAWIRQGSGGESGLGVIGVGLATRWDQRARGDSCRLAEAFPSFRCWIPVRQMNFCRPHALNMSHRPPNVITTLRRFELTARGEGVDTSVVV